MNVNKHDILVKWHAKSYTIITYYSYKDTVENIELHIQVFIKLMEHGKITCQINKRFT
jgi:hypothetical protein